MGRNVFPKGKNQVNIWIKATFKEEVAIMGRSKGGKSWF